MSEVSDRLKTCREKYERDLRNIREDPDLNDAAKGRRIAPLYERFRAEERRALEQMKAEISDEDARRCGGRPSWELWATRWATMRSERTGRGREGDT
jgi:hypothetical protein